MNKYPGRLHCSFDLSEKLAQLSLLKELLISPQPIAGSRASNTQFLRKSRTRSLSRRLRI